MRITIGVRDRPIESGRRKRKKKKKRGGEER